jgi:hypothetical protein
VESDYGAEFKTEENEDPFADLKKDVFDLEDEQEEVGIKELKMHDFANAEVTTQMNTIVSGS